MFQLQTEEDCTDDLAWRASFKAALRLAGAGKPFADGQLIKDVLLDVVETMHPALVSSYSQIPMSRNTISRRISDMADNIRDQLRVMCDFFFERS